MDIRNSCSKKYLFKTRKRAKVDVERVAHGHIVNQLQKQRKKKKKKGVSCSTALVIPSPYQWSSKSVPTETRVNCEI